MARAQGWLSDVFEEALAVTGALRSLADLDALAAETHVALGGAIRLVNGLVVRVDACWGPGAGEVRDPVDAGPRAARRRGGSAGEAPRERAERALSLDGAHHRFWMFAILVSGAYGSIPSQKSHCAFSSWVSVEGVVSEHDVGLGGGVVRQAR